MSGHLFPGITGTVLSEDALFVITVLRRFSTFRLSYDKSHLDGVAAFVEARLGSAAVDDFLSDVILLDNELRLRSNGALMLLSEGCQAVSGQELSLLRVIAARQVGNHGQAVEAAASLGIVHTRILVLLAGKLGTRLIEHGVWLAADSMQASRSRMARHAHIGSLPALHVVAAE